MLSDFFTSTLPSLGLIGIQDALALYAGYLALSVRRGLAVPIYRSRALWTAALALLFGVAFTLLGNVLYIFTSSYYDLGLLITYGAVFPAFLIVLFIWVDRTIGTLVRLDYLRRDVAGWRRLRGAYWGLAAASFIAYIYMYNSADPVVVEAYVLLILFPLAYSALVLVVGGRRTRDMTFRGHAKWLGYGLAALALLGLVSLATSNSILTSVPPVLTAYSLYKMAKLLVPVSRFPSP